MVTLIKSWGGGGRLVTLAALVAGVMIVTAGPAQGALITGVTVEDFSSQFSDRPAVRTIDSSGCTGCDTDIDDTSAGMNEHSATAQQMWLNNLAGQTAWIVWDLGGSYSVDKFRVWNYNEDVLPTRGMDEVIIRVADNAADLTGAVPAGPYTTLTTNSFSQAPGTSGYKGELFTESFTAAYVRIDNVSNHGNSDGTGLSEIRFNAAAAATPEPGTFALAALGLLGLGVVAWRRRKYPSRSA